MSNVEVSTSGSTAPAEVSPPRRPAKLTETLKLEHQFLRLPFENYKKTIRITQRAFEKDTAAVISGVGNATYSDISRDHAVNQLSSFVSRLQGLKRKLAEGDETCQAHAQRCRVRLEHMKSGTDDSPEWNQIRIKRVIVDHMLRMSYFETAAKIAECSQIQDLVDIAVFQEAKTIIDALYVRNLAPALSWCAENKSWLKKSKSKLEFQLRLQEFIELVRCGKRMAALTYCRKHLAPWAATHFKEFQHYMGTFAFKSTTQCARYKVLYQEDQWDLLIDNFKQEFYKLYNMTPMSLLEIYLQAGLSALKTQMCYEERCPKEDPLSQDTFRTLAEPLPYAKQQNSILICYITKEVMDHENPPLVLPNGCVYSTKALVEMASRNNGQITCPRSNETYHFTMAERAYIS
ncbi:protein MAEA homolog [Andrographis paniculata]|uniref:protein MAEA homolog n=1 Tax=Andrographis paniculata TaxID=175694 RepID=UPI0021E74425|nr:protein MAEA homolog [Andrographis paniculata]XP_051116449.1 protein MAEA homolog [Andrographis paniculata]